MAASKSTVPWAKEPPSPSTSPSTAPTRPPDPASRRTLLCVDDEAGVLRSLCRVLRKEPYRVRCATSAAEALDLLAQHPAQVVLTDQRMPGMTGTAFLKEVRNRYPNTVRLILSGYAEPHTIVQAVNEAEVFRFLPKPWDDDDLRATVRTAFARWESRQAALRLPEALSSELEKVRAERERLKAKLEACTSTLQALVAGTLLPGLVVDEAGHVLHHNEAAAELAGEDTLQDLLNGPSPSPTQPDDPASDSRAVIFPLTNSASRQYVVLFHPEPPRAS